jgi:hypothetical protein
MSGNSDPVTGGGADIRSGPRPGGALKLGISGPSGGTVWY